MYKFVVNDCIKLAIERQACKIIDKYIEFWPNGAKLEDYDIEQLDSKYDYLIFSHNNNYIDIFDYNDSIFTTLFLIL